MASSEGQTELLTGWSCVVHQPSEDPEPSELPSTVDITAFSAGLNIEPSANTQNDECSESGSESESGSNNSGSDGSGSCSVSDSSDSDSSSSSSSSRSSSPEFSVTSSQPNGLRLKIATVRKSCGSPAVTEKDKPPSKPPPPVEKPPVKTCNLSSSSDSGDSDSESDSNETESSDEKECAKQGKAKEVVAVKKPGKVKVKAGPEKKTAEKKVQPKKEAVSPRKTRSKRKKMASLPISRSSTSSSSDSEESDADSAMLASCSLQEIRQEDLAAILPDQQECDAFGAFEEAERNSPQTGDASGSDMELPQQAVNALIQRTTESSSESESHPPPNPSSLYANSLLQQFVAQTQMINTTTGSTGSADAQAESSQDATKQSTEAEIKRKRGRPKKVQKNQKSVDKNEYCADPNVSPDSGIQNSPDHTSSPDCSPRPINKSESQKRLNRNNKNSADVKQSKHIVTSNRFDRILYGNTDRVLYPPRRKVGRPAAVKKGPGRPPKISKSDNKTSKKQPGVKENGKTVPDKENGRTTLVKDNSKTLVKDNLKNSTAKESTKIEKKETARAVATKSSVKENLRVHTKENGKTSVAKTKNCSTEQKEKLNGNTKETKTAKSSHLHEICERVSKRLESNPGKEPETKEKEPKHKQGKSTSRPVLCTKNKIVKSKNKYLMLKNAKLMHSKHKHKKHKKCKFKILKPLSAAFSDPKLNTEIEKLVQDFVKMCCISPSKPAKENVPEILKALKKVSKKRKTSEYGERKKKKQNTTSAVEKGTNSNEQRLPLKKRHYHLSASNNENKEETQVKVEELPEDSKMKQKNVVEEIVEAKSKKCLQEETKSKQKDLQKSEEHVDAKSKKYIQKIEELHEVRNKLKMEKSEENEGKQKRDSLTSSKIITQKNEESIETDTKLRPKNVINNKTVKNEKNEVLNKKSTTVNNNKQNDSITPKISGINNNDYEIKAHIDEAIEACINKYNGDHKIKALEIKVETFEDQEKNHKLSPHLSSPKKKGEAIKVETIEVQKNVLTTTTPKKRHRLEMANIAKTEKLVEDIKVESNIENVVSEIKMRRNLGSVVKKIETSTTIQINTRQKNRLDEITSNLTESATQVNTRQKTRLDEVTSNLTENSVQMNTRQKNRLDDATTNLNTRKKNRLEDLASNLVSKISETTETQNTCKRKKEDRATVIKYPTVKKTKEPESEVVEESRVLRKGKAKLESGNDKVEDEPKVGLEKVVEAVVEKSENVSIAIEKSADVPPVGIFTPSADLENHLVKKEALDLKLENKPKSTVRIENRKKVKKRRAINRTGFPTVKKKKKKLILPPPPEVPVEEIKPSPCERVPKDGEEYSSFVERTEKTVAWPKKNSTNLIEVVEIEEKKQPLAPTNKVKVDKVSTNEESKSKEKISDEEEDPEIVNVTKWEALSECDSLPLEDRIDYDFTLKRRRDSQSSDLDDLTLEARLERLKKTHKNKRKRETLERKCNLENAARKRLRDVSPASSIEPLTEKRLLREDRASASSDESRKTKKTPRWRKKYLIAGLFSDYYKEGDEAVKQKRTELAMKTSKITYHPHEHPFGLLPAPYHCGKYLRCRKIPFQLPYDLWWQHTHSQLPGRDIVPSWNYRKIRTNVYNVKNTTGACEPQSCNCTSQAGCGDDCINRLVLAECPASHKCKNQRIQKHDWAPGIEKFMTEYKGWGVKTNLPIKSGEFILEYVGEVVSDQEFKERMATRYIHDTHHYCLHLDGGLVIDGHRMGGDGRFVNHSCAPNCEMQKWSVNGQFRMALFALRDIKAGEELTYDYNFSLFNPADGQECRCDSDNCRGVIGGKSQRIKPALTVAPSQPGRVGRPRKNQAKKALNEKKEAPTVPIAIPQSVANPINMKPISHVQRLFILEHHCFLIRNLKKVKRVFERRSSTAHVQRNRAPTPANQSTFFNNLNALRQPRNMKTRRLALADENPELKKTVQLANVLRDIFNSVADFKDENNEKLCTPFLYCPSKRKSPDYYLKITDPIDFTTIEQNIDTGVYKTVESFDVDMNKLFDNNIKFYGRTTELGISSVRLKKVYNDVKKESMPKFENVLGVKPPAKFISNKKKGEEEDIIRCICGMYRDEGLMIQCERCLVWQHCECVRADENAPSYHCENCVPRKVDYEISLDEYTEHGHQYYMTLLRGDLQLRQGDTVYVLRDIPIPGTDKKHTYDTIGEVKYTDLDIFRIERLWKDCKNGQRFAYGHHYLRPHETYHEPTRKFFPNEVMRVPLYEAVPVELIISHCWVMDLNTFCKGRPIDAPEEHIYICEYRVDKSARLFSKVSKSKFPICTKSYAFERFDTRLKVSRTYTPHDLDPAFVKQRGRKPQETECVKEPIPVQPVIEPVIRTPVDQKARLNTILLKLLNKMPTKQVIDVSYLLEGGRRRKKHI